MRLYAVHCGGERADMAAFDPFDPAVGTKVDIPYFFYVIEHREGLVLFDSGAHPALVSDPRSRIGDEADNWEITMEPGDDVVTKLGELGISPGDVKHVIHSHLHYDHCGGIEFLPPKATFYVQKPELPFAYWPAVYQRGLYVRGDFDHPVSWQELSGEHDVFNDGRVVIFPTPGHTPGHQSVLVRLEGRSIVLIGDAAYLPQKMRDRLLPSVVWSPDAMVASWERIEELQRQTGAELLFTHDLDFKDKTLMAPAEWYE